MDNTPSTCECCGVKTTNRVCCTCYDKHMSWLLWAGPTKKNKPITTKPQPIKASPLLSLGLCKPNVARALKAAPRTRDGKKDPFTGLEKGD